MARRYNTAAPSRTAAGSVCLLVLVALGSLPRPAPAQSTGVLPREQLQGLIAESSKALDNLVLAREQPSSPALAFKRDRRGKNPTDDFKQSLLPMVTQLKLEALEIGAKKDLDAGDLPGAQIQLTELRQGLKTEIERYQAITEYWRETASQPYVDGASRKTTLQANGIETPNRAEIETLVAQLDQQVAAGDFMAAMHTTWPKLNELQKQAKSSEYQQLMSKLDSGGLQGLRSATPTRKCSPAEGKTPAAETPAVRADFPSNADYFPTLMKRKGIKSGTPEVFVIVSAEGCPERAVLVGPAEHEEFDDAGVRLAVDGRYYPAQKDGKPVRGGFYMRLSFFNLF
jgi:hypothetical protein